jgi:hypothetical protein
MFSAFSGWVSSAADAVNRISDQGLDVVRQTGLIDALQSATAPTNPAAAASTDKQLAVKDFMTPPAAWMGSSDEWQWCVKAAMNDINTCAITPTTMKSDENLWQEIYSLTTGLLNKSAATPEVGPSATAANLLNDVEGCYSPSADLVDFIQAHTDIYTVRSYVVPLFTSDENYWLNLGWRLALYQLCTNAGDLLTMMQTMSKLPARLHDIANAAKRATAKAAEAQRATAARREAALASKISVKDEDDSDDGTDDDEKEDEVVKYVNKPHLTDNSAYWSEKQQQYEAEQEKFAWLRETQERVKKEMELARGNVKLLDSLLQRQEASSTLGVSVCDSCKYHKVKLSRLIGEICAAPVENTKGTVLDAETGSLFVELFQCNEDVKNVLHAYAGCSQEPGHSGGSPKSQAPPMSSSTPTSPLRADSASAAAANDAASSLVAQPADTRVSPSLNAQSVAPSSAVERSAAGSKSHTPVAVKNNSDDDDDDEGSFEAKLPWSMDD